MCMRLGSISGPAGFRVSALGKCSGAGAAAGWRLTAMLGRRGGANMQLHRRARAMCHES